MHEINGHSPFDIPDSLGQMNEGVFNHPVHLSRPNLWAPTLEGSFHRGRTAHSGNGCRSTRRGAPRAATVTALASEGSRAMVGGRVG